MIKKEEYEEKINYYEKALEYQPNDKEKQKILKEIEYLKERILFLINK